MIKIIHRQISREIGIGLTIMTGAIKIPKLHNFAQAMLSMMKIDGLNTSAGINYCTLNSGFGGK